MQRKQPEDGGVIKKHGCAIKMAGAFSLKFQRNNQYTASTMDSADGKAGEKGCLFTAPWRCPPHAIPEPFRIRAWLKPCALHHKKAVRTGIEGTSRHTLSASSPPERGSAGRPLPLQAETVLQVSSKHSRMPHERIQPSCTHVPLRQPFSGGHRRQPGTF